jgi:hypothetical protein
MSSTPLTTLIALLLTSCAAVSYAPVNDDDLEMRTLVAETPTRPRSDIASSSTFYRIVRGQVVIDFAAADLATALEKHHAENPRIHDDAELAKRLRDAIAKAATLVVEADLPSELAGRATFQFADVFRAGGYRVVAGAEEGSSLVIGEYSFSTGGSGMTFAGGGVVFFWSRSRTRIFSVNYWIT